GAGAGRKRGDGGGPALVAQVVEENLAGAGGLGHLREVELWVGALHHENEVVGEGLDLGPFAVGLGGRDDVDAFATGGLDEGLEAEILHEVADFEGAGDETIPRETGVGVEVDDEAV